MANKFYGVTVEPEIFLPSQFFAALNQRARDFGERRLMVAILEDAVGCFQKYLPRGKRKDRRFVEAEEWFLSDDETWPFSFINICYVLDLEYSNLRRRLMKWKQEMLEQRAFQQQLWRSGDADKEVA